MILKPNDLGDLQALLSRARAEGGKITGLDLGALGRLVAHTPEDLTARVEAGMTLADFQAALASKGQWLPLDPPLGDRLTLGALVATGASGPRRFGYGTIRDYLIGIKIVTAEGKIVRSGGQVVKNVAGFDLAKLIVGSWGSLGIIIEATFKLAPLPMKETFLVAELGDPDRAMELVFQILDQGLSPSVVDLHNLETPSGPSEKLRLVVGFSGDSNEVDDQTTTLQEIARFQAGDLRYHDGFWSAEGPRPASRSVLPSRLAAELKLLGRVPFIARAAEGILYCKAGKSASRREGPHALEHRLKRAFDRLNLFPEIPN